MAVDDDDKFDNGNRRQRQLWWTMENNKKVDKVEIRKAEHLIETDVKRQHSYGHQQSSLADTDQ